MEKFFNIVSSRVEAILKTRKFKKLEQVDKNTAMFVGENIAYGVFYNENKKQFELKT